MRKHFKEGYVYIAQGQTDLLRIGFTTDVSNREANHAGLGFHFIYVSDYLPDAYQVEQVVHKLLKQWRVAKSIYHIHRDVAELTIKLAIEGVASGKAAGFYTDNRARDAVRRKRPLPKLFTPHRAPKIMV